MNPDLTVPRYPNIFVVGDLATLDGKNGKPLPGVAQVAMQGGHVRGEGDSRTARGKAGFKAFSLFRQGRHGGDRAESAVANIFGISCVGLSGVVVWLFIHLMYLVEFQNRVIVFMQWGFEYLTFSRGAR